MKLIILSALVMFSTMSFAKKENAIEVLAASWQASVYTHPELRCTDIAYNLEALAMEKTNDFDVKVRKSRVVYSNVYVNGYTAVYCYVKYLSSNKTKFEVEVQSHPVMNCYEKEMDAQRDLSVVWSDYFNRVRLSDGSKGCQVKVIRGISM